MNGVSGRNKDNREKKPDAPLLKESDAESLRHVLYTESVRGVSNGNPTSTSKKKTLETESEIIYKSLQGDNGVILRKGILSIDMDPLNEKNEHIQPQQQQQEVRTSPPLHKKKKSKMKAKKIRSDVNSHSSTGAQKHELSPPPLHHDSNIQKKEGHVLINTAKNTTIPNNHINSYTNNTSSSTNNTKPTSDTKTNDGGGSTTNATSTNATSNATTSTNTSTTTSSTVNIPTVNASTPTTNPPGSTAANLSTSSSTTNGNTQQQDRMQKLNFLKELMDQGYITVVEFKERKSQIIDELTGTRTITRNSHVPMRMYHMKEGEEGEGKGGGGA